MICIVVVVNLKIIYANVRQLAALHQNCDMNPHPIRAKKNFYFLKLIYLKHGIAPFAFQFVQVNQNEWIGEHFGIGNKQVLQMDVLH